MESSGRFSASAENQYEEAGVSALEDFSLIFPMLLLYPLRLLFSKREQEGVRMCRISSSIFF